MSCTKMKINFLLMRQYRIPILNTAGMYAVDNRKNEWLLITIISFAVTY